MRFETTTTPCHIFCFFTDFKRLVGKPIKFEQYLTFIRVDFHSAAKENNEETFEKAITTSNDAIGNIRNFLDLSSLEDKAKNEIVGIVIPFCEEVLSILHKMKRKGVLADQCEVGMKNFSDFLNLMRDLIIRDKHVDELKSISSEKYHPSTFPGWLEKVQENLTTTQCAQVLVGSINFNQMPLLQSALAQVKENTDSTNPIPSLRDSYAKYILPICHQFLLEGRVLASAEVMAGIGKDVILELNSIVDESFDWHVAENIIGFLGDLGRLPPAESVALFTSMASCLGNCPCECNGVKPAFTKIDGEVDVKGLDSVLKYYYQQQANDDRVFLSEHDCKPIPFPFKWIKQLSAVDRRKMLQTSSVLKSGSHSQNESQVEEDLKSMMAKGDFERFLNLAKLNSKEFLQFMLHNFGNNVKPRIPTFFWQKLLSIIDLDSMEFKSLTEKLIDNVLTFEETSQVIACSRSASSEHLSERFTSDDADSHLLQEIAKIVCKRNYRNLFLALCFNKPLNFAKTVASLNEKPHWAAFLEQSREHLQSDDEISGEFVKECVKFTGKDYSSSFADRYYAYFNSLLNGCENDEADLETSAVVAKFSNFLLALFHGETEENLENSRLLYTILRCNMIFDVTKLFKFQHFNYLATEEADECMAECFNESDDFPPSFLRSSIAQVPSQELLLSKQWEMPDSVSFLGFGRPLRAVLQHLLTTPTTNTQKLQKLRSKLEERVFNLAIENADNAPIVAASLLFLKLLGFTPERLQCAICVLRLLQGQKQSALNLLSSVSPSPYSPVTFCKLAFSKLEKYQTDVEMICFNELAVVNYDLYASASTLAVLDRLVPSKNQFDSGLRPAWSRLLISLASSNNWLAFFTFAEVLHVDPKELLQLASWFSNPHLKSHIVKTAKKVSIDMADLYTEDIEDKKQSKTRKKMRKRSGKVPSDSESDRETRGSRDQPPNIEVESPAKTRFQRLPSMSYQREHDLMTVVLQVTSSKSETSYEDFVESAYRLKNPLCAIYAACLYRPDKTACLLAYLHCYFPNVVEENPNTEVSLLDQMVHAVTHLSAKRAFKTLYDAFSIILPSCPLSKLF